MLSFRNLCGHAIIFLETFRQEIANEKKYPVSWQRIKNDLIVNFHRQQIAAEQYAKR